MSGATFTKYIPKSGRNAGEERYFISAWRKDTYTGHFIKCTCTEISGSETSKGIVRERMKTDDGCVLVPMLCEIVNEHTGQKELESALYNVTRQRLAIRSKGLVITRGTGAGYFGKGGYKMNINK